MDSPPDDVCTTTSTAPVPSGSVNCTFFGFHLRIVAGVPPTSTMPWIVPKFFPLTAAFPPGESTGALMRRASGGGGAGRSDQRFRPTCRTPRSSNRWKKATPDSSGPAATEGVLVWPAPPRSAGMPKEEPSNRVACALCPSLASWSVNATKPAPDASRATDGAVPADSSTVTGVDHAPDASDDAQTRDFCTATSALPPGAIATSMSPASMPSTSGAGSTNTGALQVEPLKYAARARHDPPGL